MIRFILGRIGVALVAAAVLAAGAAIFVVALAFALFALVRPALGPAGAAGVVALAAAVLVLAVGVALALMPKRKAPKVSPRGKDAFERARNFFKDAPLTGIAAAAAVGFLAIRNPGYLGAVIRSFLEGRESPKRRRRAR